LLKIFSTQPLKATEIALEQREIWFKRLLWSYIPCHWKGWAMIVGLVACFLISMQILSWVVSATGHSDWDFVPFLPILPIVVLGWIVAERHTGR
jgi:hypothetical protein